MKQELLQKLSITLEAYGLTKIAHRRKCAKLARAMSFQNNDKTKIELWKLFKAA